MLILALPIVLISVYVIIRLIVGERNLAIEACAKAVEQYASGDVQPRYSTPLSEYIHAPLEVITPENVPNLQEIATFHAATGEIKLTTDQIEIYRPDSFGYDLQAVSPDQQQIAVIKPGMSSPSTVYLCSNPQGDVVHSLHSDETTNAVQFDSQEKFLALNEGRGTILILDANSLELFTLIDVRNGERWRSTREISFHPSGNLIAFAMQDHTNSDYSVRLWDMAQSQQLIALTGYDTRIFGLTFNSDGTILAASGLDGIVRLWGVQSS